jgi:hypothetical protein
MASGMTASDFFNSVLTARPGMTGSVILPYSG